MLKLDRIDRHILTLMQQDGRISNLDLAEKVGLSPSPCSRRVKALEDEGLILNHVTLLNPERLNLKLTAHIRRQPIPEFLVHNHSVTKVAMVGERKVLLHLMHFLGVKVGDGIFGAIHHARLKRLVDLGESHHLGNAT